MGEAQQENEKERELAFYAAALDAFYTTSLEYDKSLFALSAGGVGLLVTLLTTVGITSLAELVGYLSGILCFVVTLGIVLVIFKRNKDHIVAVVNRTEKIEDRTLSRLDMAARWTFGLGATCCAFVGIFAAVYSYNHPKEGDMAETKKTTSSPVTTGDSIDGIRNLRPDVLQKSFHGVEQLRPQTSSNASSAATQSAQPTSSTAQTGGSTPSASAGPAPTKGN